MFRFPSTMSKHSVRLAAPSVAAPSVRWDRAGESQSQRLYDNDLSKKRSPPLSQERECSGRSQATMVSSKRTADCVQALDWEAVYQGLDSQGSVTIKGMLSPTECRVDRRPLHERRLIQKSGGHGASRIRARRISIFLLSVARCSDKLSHRYLSASCADRQSLECRNGHCGALPGASCRLHCALP